MRNMIWGKGITILWEMAQSL